MQTPADATWSVMGVAVRSMYKCLKRFDFKMCRPVEKPILLVEQVTPEA